MGIIGLEHLAQDIVEAYSSGVDDITAQALSAARERAKECRDNIKKDSPHKSNKYALGWKFRKVKDGYEVYNKNRPNIEMPLEHGRVITKGPHKGERTKAIPHIYDNADAARDAFVNDCLKISRNGGRG